MEYSNDISTEAYQEIQDSLEWSYELIVFGIFQSVLMITM